MYRILFAKNMLGEDEELLNFVKRRFDILVLTLSGSQLASSRKSIEYLHNIKSKIYFRINFISSTQIIDLALDKVFHNNGADGFVFQGQSTENLTGMLLAKFSELAKDLSERKITKPIVFMVDRHIGNIDMLREMNKLVVSGDFPKDIDVRVAVRVSAKNFIANKNPEDANLFVVDFNPHDGSDMYSDVLRVSQDKNLGAIAYMTYDIMSNKLRDAISNYDTPAIGITTIPIIVTNKSLVTIIHSVMLRDNPSGSIMKDKFDIPISVPAKSVIEFSDSTIENANDIWYKVDLNGYIGWIAGKIGNTEYSKE